MSSFAYHKGRPHVPVFLIFATERRPFLPLLDSAADYSLFHEADAALLGLDWSKGRAQTLSGANGASFQAREFLVTMEIAGHRFPVRVSFAAGIPLEEHRLLGRRGVFEHFAITIREREGIVDLIPAA
jgi:hypothetical protein